MQLSGDVALDTAVNADVRYVCWRFEVDWNKDGNYSHAYSDLSSVVKSMMPDRDITSTLPFETSMVEGFMAAQLTVRLGGTRDGDTLSIGDILAPLRTDSPLYGQARVDTPCRAWIGMTKADGTETLLQQFQGKISSCRVGASKEATILALDGAEDTRAQIDLPYVYLSPGSSTAPMASMRIKINSQWPIDYVFRKNGKYSSPPPHSKVFYCATMHGSIIPEIGHSTEYWVGDGIVTEDTQMYYPGRPGWGLAYGSNSTFYFLTKSRAESTLFTAAAGQSLVIQCQADLSKAPTQHPSSWGTLLIYSTGNSYFVGTSFRLNVNPVGKLTLDFYNDLTLVTTVNGPTLGTAGWTDIWVEIELGSPLSNSTVRFPGSTVTGVNLSALSSPTLALYPHITTIAAVPMQDLHISDRTGLATGTTRYNPATWTPQVDLDPGLNEMTGMPLRRGVQSWELLKEIVGAELGVVGYSESGRAFFKNRDTVRAQNLTIEKTISGNKEVVDAGQTENSGALRNNITITSSERLMTGPADSATAWRTVYNLDNPNQFVLPPGTTVVDVTMDVAGALPDPYVAPTLYTTAQWQALSNPDQVHGFAVSTIGGVQITSGVSMTVIPMSPQLGPDLLRLVIVNNAAGGTHLKFMTTDFSPALKLRGRSPYQADPIRMSFKRNGSIAKYGERVYEVPNSDWIQTVKTAQTLATGLLNDLAIPVPIIDQIEAVGDPRIQLGDSHLLDDAEGIGGPIYTNLVGLQRNLDIAEGGGKLTDRLTIRPFSAPGKWILGHPTQSQLGSTTKL